MKKLMKYLMAYILVFGISFQALMPIHAYEEEVIQEEEVVQDEIIDESEIIDEEPILEEAVEEIEVEDNEDKKVTDKIVDEYLIDELNATISEPKAGASVNDLTITFPNNQHYTASISGAYLTFGTVVPKFEAGQSYRIEVKFEAEANYYISKVDNLTVKINGQIAERKSSSGGFMSNNESVVYTIDFHIKSPTNTYKIYTINSTAYKNGAVVTEAEPGEVITVKSNLNDGYKFINWSSSSNNITFKDPNQTTTTFVMPEAMASVTVDYDLMYYNKVYATIPVPVEGEYITNSISTETDEYYAEITNWYINGTINQPEAKISLPHKFNNKYSYYADVIFHKNAGNRMGKDTVCMVNGMEAHNLSYKTNGTQIECRVEVHTAAIQSHEYIISNPTCGIPELIEGASTSTLPTSIPLGSHYKAQLEKVQFSGGSSIPKTYIGGYSYDVYIKFTADPGYKFAAVDDLNVEINGIKADRYSNSGGMVNTSETITYKVEMKVAPSDGYYNIGKYTNVTCYVNNVEVTSAKAGQTVVVKVADSVKDFESWIDYTNHSSLTGNTNRTASFVMPENNVSINYKKSNYTASAEQIHVNVPLLELGKYLPTTATVVESDKYTAYINQYYIGGTESNPGDRINGPYTVKAGHNYIASVCITAKNGSANKNAEVYVNGHKVQITSYLTDGSAVFCRYDLMQGSSLLKEGWHQRDTYWFYVDSNHQFTRGWKKINNKWYYFLEKGTMATNKQTIDGKIYYFGSDGAMKYGWQTYNDRGYIETYYLDSKGAAVNGWQKIDNVWYYFSYGVLQKGILRLKDATYYLNPTNGALKTNSWTKINNNWYYLDGSGKFITGWKKLNEKWYYFDSTGMMVTGKYDVNGVPYWFNDNGSMISDSWKNIGSKWYYIGSNGKTYDGIKEVDGKYYWFTKDGTKTGIQMIDNCYYEFTSPYGSMKQGFVKIYGNTYYYEAGKIISGWKKINGNWYYFDLNGRNKMITSGQYINGNFYMFGSDGVMFANKWHNYSTGWCYYDENGKEATGWKQIKGIWYYFDPDHSNFMIENKLFKINGKTYFFDEKGAMKTGWVSFNSYWYYAEINGSLVTGWKQVGSYWYYFTSDFKMVSNTSMTIDGKVYKFDSKGHWIK